MIEKIAQKIHEYGIDVAAILMFESVKPLSHIGTQMGRLFISPLLPALGENFGISGEKLFQILEKHENVEKIIQTIEKLTQEEEERKKAEKSKKLEEKKEKMGKRREPVRKGWRRFLHF